MTSSDTGTRTRLRRVYKNDNLVRCTSKHPYAQSAKRCNTAYKPARPHILPWLPHQSIRKGHPTRQGPFAALPYLTNYIPITSVLPRRKHTLPIYIRRPVPFITQRRSLLSSFSCFKLPGIGASKLTIERDLSYCNSVYQSTEQYDTPSSKHVIIESRRVHHRRIVTAAEQGSPNQWQWQRCRGAQQRRFLQNGPSYPFSGPSSAYSKREPGTG